MTHRAALLILAIAFLVLVAARQGPPPPPPPPPPSPLLARDEPAHDTASSATASGTASLAGRVVSSETPARPVRRASVRLGGTGTTGGQLAVTDDDGRFAFVGLAAARYSIT